MRICVFGAASSVIDEKYKEAGYLIGESVVRAGYELVFGGGEDGLMGASARGAKAAGGHVIGIIPEYFKGETREKLFKECSEVIYTPDISSRIKLMTEMSDAFIITPGGIGTYEEFFEVLVEKSLDRFDKPIALLNIEGFFDPLLDMMRDGVEKGFIEADRMDMFTVMEGSSPEDIEKIMKS